MLLNTSEAVDCLRLGQVIAYPTEAVYGIGCDPHNEDAVSKILALKHRTAAAGLILIGSTFEQFRPWVGPVPGARLELALSSWPGPVTWLFPKSKDAPGFVTGAHDTVAIRVTAHPQCIELCDRFGGPIVSTSANPHSASPARSAGEVEAYFGPFLGGILEGALGGKQQPSEIRDLLTGKVIRGG
jgi:tRNA threonylcarbamoyl adenosine modification protein (Sua5/YciO/YrdC/YwlC family)